MDERSARTMLRHLAERNYDETTVDVDRAIRGGRRRRRRRAVAWVAAAVALVIGGVGAATIPALRDEPNAIRPVAPRFEKATGADLQVGKQRLQVGWRPDGVVGTTTVTGPDSQVVHFLAAGNQDAGPLTGQGPASVWLVEAASPLTFTEPGGPTVPGPVVHGAPSTWFEITGGPAPGGTLTWTPSPGLRAMVIAGSTTVAARIADSVRTDLVGPVRLPFTLPRPDDLQVSATVDTRYDNADYFAAVTFRKKGENGPIASEILFWLAHDTLPEHNSPPTRKLHGRGLRLSDGPPENGVNVWYHLGAGVVAGSTDAAQNGRYLRDRAGVIAMVESLRPVDTPADVDNWTNNYLR
ncbi:hypothetical protein [Cryptosporangium japonicum]|uniref:Anti-sigma factor n=1 Tax=Cryptosporangium japonicum TaxID=80872 RepID=A0ABP3DV29_9ACTN